MSKALMSNLVVTRFWSNGWMCKTHGSGLVRWSQLSSLNSQAGCLPVTPALPGQEGRSQQLWQDWAAPLFLLSFVGLSSCDVCCNQGIAGLCFLCCLYIYISVLGVNVKCCPRSAAGPGTMHMPKANLPQRSCSCWTRSNSRLPQHTKGADIVEGGPPKRSGASSTCAVRRAWENGFVHPEEEKTKRRSSAPWREGGEKVQPDSSGRKMIEQEVMSPSWNVRYSG